jgi:uncharacterized protein with GYD domain
MENEMFRLIARAKLTREYTIAYMKSPEDREAAVRKLVESTGGKLIAFYYTTGDADITVIAEASDPETILAALMGAVARGAISDVNTSRAWTASEFKIVAEKAAATSAIYRLPGEA